MKCRICGQKMRNSQEAHHLEHCPIDRSICLGCWIGWLELEKFAFRATGRTFFSLTVQEGMRLFLDCIRRSSPVQS